MSGSLKLTGALAEAFGRVERDLAILFGTGYWTLDEWVKIDGLLHKGEYFFTNGPGKPLVGPGKPLVGLETPPSSVAQEELVQGHEKDGGSEDLLLLGERDPDTPSMDPAANRPDYPPSDTLFIRNVPWNVHQTALSEAFGAYGGSINTIRVPSRSEEGKTRDYGFVTFASVDDAKAALERMQGTHIAGRPIYLEYASPVPEQRPPQSVRSRSQTSWELILPEATSPGPPKTENETRLQPSMDTPSSEAESIPSTGSEPPKPFRPFVNLPQLALTFKEGQEVDILLEAQKPNHSASRKAGVLQILQNHRGDMIQLREFIEGHRFVAKNLRTGQLGLIHEEIFFAEPWPEAKKKAGASEEKGPPGKGT